MKTNYVLLPLLFLLLGAGALAAPLVRVQPTVMICEGTKCSNSTTVKEGLEHIPSPFTTNLRLIQVFDSTPREVDGKLLIADTSEKGVLILRVQGVNTTAYRKAVTSVLQASYAAPRTKYPLPSWMPYPGQCDMGVRLTTSRGTSVCVRRR